MEIKHLNTLTARYGGSTKIITDFEKKMGYPQYSKQDIKGASINQITFLIGLKSNIAYGNQRDINLYEITISNPEFRFTKSNKKFYIKNKKDKLKFSFVDALYNNNNINYINNSDELEIKFKNIIKIL